MAVVAAFGDGSVPLLQFLISADNGTRRVALGLDGQVRSSLHQQTRTSGALTCIASTCIADARALGQPTRLPGGTGRRESG
jgi:hypothetical protein